MHRHPQAGPPLLCELHAHTTWSDGALTVVELAELHGDAGFDVLCVTDHAVRPGTGGRAVRAADHAAYLAEICAPARARSRHDLLLLSGLLAGVPVRGAAGHRGLCRAARTGRRGRPLRAQPARRLRLGRRERLQSVASGDFQRPEHLAGWKTLLPCAKEERAVVEYLPSPAPAILMRFEPAAPAPLAA